jgi:TatD DNase family protein
MYNLVDAHCHLQDYRLVAVIDDVICRALQQHVGSMMCCGTEENDWEQVLALSSAHHEIKAALGIHPWFASGITGDAWKDRLCSLLQAHPQAIVGEIGLDYMLENVAHEQQEKIFIDQLRIAREYCRPVTLHCRSAFGRLADILAQEGGVPHGGMLHSYSGSSDMVRIFEQLGLYISFSGSITYPEHKRACAAAAAVSLNRLLIETDCPDGRPAEVTGTINEPENLMHVVRALAGIKKCSVDDIAAYTTANALKVYSCAFSS